MTKCIELKSIDDILYKEYIMLIDKFKLSILLCIAVDNILKSKILRIKEEFLSSYIVKNDTNLVYDS